MLALTEGMFLFRVIEFLVFEALGNGGKYQVETESF